MTSDDPNSPRGGPVGPGAPLPSRRRRAARVDRGPRRLADSLDDAVIGLRPPAGMTHGAEERGPTPPASALARLFTRWDEIVGPALAQHVRPLTLTREVLSVAVDQPAWATQVRLLAPTILERVAEVVGEVPGRLRVTVRPIRDGR